MRSTTIQSAGSDIRAQSFEAATRTFENSLQNVSSTSGNIFQAFEEIREEIEGENSYMRVRIDNLGDKTDLDRNQIQHLQDEKEVLELKAAKLSIKFQEMMTTIELFERHRKEITYTASLLNDSLNRARKLKGLDFEDDGSI